MQGRRRPRPQQQQPEQQQPEQPLLHPALRRLVYQSAKVFQRLCTQQQQLQQEEGVEEAGGGAEETLERIREASQEYRALLTAAEEALWAMGVVEEPGEDEEQRAAQEQELETSVQMLRLVHYLWHLSECFMLHPHAFQSWNLVAWLRSVVLDEENDFDDENPMQRQALAEFVHRCRQCAVPEDEMMVATDDEDGEGGGMQVFWPTVYRCVAHGNLDAASAVLRTHSEFRGPDEDEGAADDAADAAAERAAQGILGMEETLVPAPRRSQRYRGGGGRARGSREAAVRALIVLIQQHPVFRGSGALALSSFQGEWDRWHFEMESFATRALAKQEDILGADAARVTTLLKLLAGDEETIAQVCAVENGGAGPWAQMLATILYRHPTPRRQEAFLLAQQCVQQLGDDADAAESNFNKMMLGVMDLKAAATLRACFGIGMNNLGVLACTAHLADLLARAGALDTLSGGREGPASIAVREDLLLQLATGIANSAPDGWKLAAAYLRFCPTRGAQAADSFFRDVDVRSDRDARELIDACESFGLTETLRFVASNRAHVWLNRGKWGLAAHWLLRADDLWRLAQVCELAVEATANTVAATLGMRARIAHVTPDAVAERAMAAPDDRAAVQQQAAEFAMRELHVYQRVVQGHIHRCQKQHQQQQSTDDAGQRTFAVRGAHAALSELLSGVPQHSAVGGSGNARAAYIVLVQEYRALMEFISGDDPSAVATTVPHICATVERLTGIDSIAPMRFWPHLLEMTCMVLDHTFGSSVWDAQAADMPTSLVGVSRRTSLALIRAFERILTSQRQRDYLASWDEGDETRCAHILAAAHAAVIADDNRAFARKTGSVLMETSRLAVDAAIHASTFADRDAAATTSAAARAGTVAASTPGASSSAAAAAAAMGTTNGGAPDSNTSTAGLGGPRSARPPSAGSATVGLPCVRVVGGRLVFESQSVEGMLQTSGVRLQRSGGP